MKRIVILFNASNNSKRRLFANLKLTRSIISLLIYLSLLGASQAKAGILNGSFTYGSQNWKVHQNFHCTNSGYTSYRTPPGYAWFGANDGQLSTSNNIWGTLTQSFIMPSSFNSASIDFYTKITTEEVTTTMAYDYMNCTITDGTTNQTSQIKLSNLNASSSYILRSIPIPAAMAGHRLTLTFYAQNDPAKGTVFRIDDVSLNIVTASKADLLITSASVSPSTVEAGSTTTVSYTLKNQGNASAGSSYSAIWLDNNNNGVFDGSPTDTQLSDQANTSLSAGASQSYSISVFIPSGVSGSKKIMVGCDATGVVTESNETNNQYFTPITVTAPQSTITVTSPNGGESWQMGTTHDITWTSSNLSGNVKVEVNGNYPSGTWEVLYSSIPNNGTISWTVSGVAGTAKRIRITSVDNPAITDMSDANFSLTAPQSTITVTSPNGGESWQMGTTHNITWTSSNLSGNVKVEVNGNYPSGAWESLAPSVANTGSFSWSISTAAAAGTAKRVRITSVDNPAITDMSDANFTLTAPASTITVTSPNGGESWEIGSSHNITWNSANLTGNVKVEINGNYPSGAWEVLYSSIPNNRTEPWTVSGVAGTAKRVRITSVDNPAITDMSDANFTLTAPASTITVTSPNGGESWQMGTTHNITWTSSNLSGNVKVEVNGNYPTGAWEVLASSVANTESFSWAISTAASAGTAKRVRITSVDNPAITDMSDANFSLTAPQSTITVTSPNGGESWQIGTTQNITWNSSNVSGNVKVEVNGNYPSGAWEVLYSSIPNNGTVSWTVSGVAGAAKRIRITSVDNPAITDMSDANFSLTAPQSNISQIQWSGLTWNVRDETGTNPGPNNWAASSSNVWVDNDGNLHLKIIKDGDKWYCSEISSLESFGYGEYSFQVSTNVENLDKNVVLGLFTYESDTKEIDLEFARWDDNSNSVGWYVVQPSTADSRNNFKLNLSGDYSTHKFTWSPEGIFFQSFHGFSTDYPINQWNYTGPNNPLEGNAKVHINFWLKGGFETAPSNKQEAEVIIKSFSFKKVINSGNLSIALKNIDNTSVPLPGANGKLLLYNSDNIYQNKYSKTDATGDGTFSNLNFGDYIVEAYNIPTGNNTTIFGEEYWGKKSITHYSAMTSATIDRDMPYLGGYKIINVATGQDVTGKSVSAGTQLRIDVNVINPNTETQKIKVRLVADRDKLQVSGYDIDNSSEESTINGKDGSTNGIAIKSILFTPNQPGEYYGAIGVQTSTNGTNYAYTDGSSWKSKFITVTNTTPTGGLTVTVKNVPDGNASLPGTNGVVELYKKGANSPFDTKRTNQNGVASFTGIPVGDGYSYKVFYDSQNKSSPFEKEYWGLQQNITINADQTANSSFDRNMPYGGDIKIYNGTTDVTGQTVEPGTPLTVKYTIFNPSTSPVNAKGTIYLDESKLFPWDYTLNGTLQSIPPGASIVQEYRFVPQKGSAFYPYGLVNIESISATGATLCTDNTAWGNAPLLKVTIPSNSQNLLDAFVNLANHRTDEEGNLIQPIDKLYKQNKKEFVFVKANLPVPDANLTEIGVQLYFDLADIYSYAMQQKGYLNKVSTIEGSKGWVTVWVNGHIGVGLGADAPVGITPPVTFTSNQPDPKMSFNFEGPSLHLTFLNVSSIESNMDGESWGEIKKTNSVGLKASAVDLSFNVYRFEVNIDELNKLFNSAYNSSLGDGQLTQSESSSLLNSMVGFDESSDHPNGDRSKLIPKSLSELNTITKKVFRSFSSTDDNNIGVDGVINFLNGGIQNNDKTRDNIYPVIPKTYNGLPLLSNQAELTFQNTGNETADFYIKVVNVPNGWVVGSKDKYENTFFPDIPDYRYDFPDARTSWNSEYYTFWTIGCIDVNAPDDPELTFELWQNKSGFDKLLQTKKIIVHKQKAVGINAPPSISNLKAFAISENPTKNIEISWTASDPDDDATIDIAVDLNDASSEPWNSGSVHHWIATDIHEDSNINTFNWNIVGFPSGTYSLWAVIYDGKNSPVYIKSDDQISISSLFDSKNPYVKIISSKIIWANLNPSLDVKYFDDQGLNNAKYQVITLPLTKSSYINESIVSSEVEKELADDSNWQNLTSNGLSILPESQFCLSDSITTEWKVNESDWDKMVENSQNGLRNFIYFKATDDAGNTYISKDNSEALEIKIDTIKPHLTINYPSDGQRIDSKNIDVQWSADDSTKRIESSGIDSLYIALDQSNEFTKLNKNETEYSLNNLSDGIHKVYMKAKDVAGNFSDLKLTQFSVNSNIPLPVVTITGIYDVLMNSIQAGGSVTDDKGVEIVSKGFCWGADSNPTIALSTRAEDGAGNGTFSTKIMDLYPGVTYHVRAYATNCIGTAYSEDVKVTTNSSASIPSVITTDVSNISSGIAITGGFIISDGDSPILSRGVCWSTNSNPTIEDLFTSDGQGTGSFTSSIAGLAGETTYHVRAYATNSVGTAYGQDIVFSTTEISPSISDSLALVAIYNKCDGPNWTRKANWLTGPMGTWEGVTIKAGRVVELNFGNASTPAAGLVGVIPAAFSNLTALKILSLERNKLSGSLPENWSNLRDLTTLSLSGNQISGSLPASWSALVNLQILSLSGNQISGSLPASWSALVNLRGIYLMNNQLTGNLPDSWSALVNLEEIYLNGNQISGSLPNSWTSLNKLHSLVISNNEISGLPDFSNLTNLTELDVSNNLLDFGDIEPNIGIQNRTFNYSPQAAIGDSIKLTKTPGQEFNISVTVGGQSNKYQWLKNGERITGATKPEYLIPTVTIKDTGEYTCEITNSIATELKLTSNPITLRVKNQTPIIGTITQPTCSVATGSVFLSGLPSGNWTINPGNVTGSTSSITISGLSAGTYNFTVTTDVGGTSDPSADVVINAEPGTPEAPTIGTITQPTCSVATGSVFLSGLPTGNWTINPGNTIGSNDTTTISGLSKGAYFFTVTNEAGCTSIISSGVVILSQPETPSAPIVGTIIQPTCSAATGSVVLSGLPFGSWTINPGNITGSTSSTNVSGLSAGTYNFTVTNVWGCTSDASDGVVINSPMDKPVTPVISLLNDTTLHSDASAGNQWYNQTGLLSDATNQDYIAKTGGDYYAIVTLNGCSSDSSNVISVVISGITFYGDQKTIKIYPNPFTKELIIENKGIAGNISFEILNASGQIIYKGKFTDKTKISTSGFAPGVYIIKFERKNSVEFHKAIKN